MNAPRDTGGRFRAGATGNPQGRPRKDRSFDSSVLKAANETVTVTEQGKRKRKAKIAVAAAQVFNMAASGNLPAAKMGFDLLNKAEERSEANTLRAPVMTKLDHEIAARVVARIADIISGGHHAEPQA
jgi:hypothetical protein